MHGSSDPDGERETVAEEGIRMNLSVSDPEAARELRISLGNTDGISISVDCVAQEGSLPCVITVDYLSEQQLETAEIAVRRGYYETPREVSLAELADEFGVSKSAVSQRLTHVERKLVRSLVKSCRGGG